MWGGALNYRPLLFCKTVLQLAVTEEVSSAYLGNKGCLVRLGEKREHRPQQMGFSLRTIIIPQ